MKNASGQGALDRQRHDFRPWWRPAAIVSLVLILLSLGSFAVRGLNLGIDFEGGGVWEVPDESNEVGDIRDAMSEVGFGEASIQEVTVGDERFFRVRADVEELGAEADSITNALAAVSGSDINDIGVTTVGPSWGEEITGAATRALVVFFIVMALYISVRLEWRMAIGALAAVVHDMIITLGAYSLFQLEVTPATVIAFLTIMGYSIYDTIIVYDRARENEGRFAASGRITYPEVMSLSLDQVLGRSINTTITSILPVLSMLVIGAGLLGAVILKDFAVALLIGLVLGGYSSLFVAAPIVVLLKSRQERWSNAADKSAMREASGASRSNASSPARTAAASSTAADTSASASGEATGDADVKSGAQRSSSSVIKPRGRKKGRRG